MGGYGNKNFGCVLVGLFVVFASCGNFLLADEDLVGSLGDLSRAEIVGCKITTPDAIRFALELNTQFQWTRAPSAIRHIFLATVQRKLIESYQLAGCPAARVDVQADPKGDHLVIRIDEGAQIIAGDVQVRGEKLLDAGKLISALTAAAPNESAAAQIDSDHQVLFLPTWANPDNTWAEPLWDVGEPAFFGKSELDQIQNVVSRAFLEQGFFWANFAIAEPIDEKGKAHIVIQVFDEGPKATLGKVEVHGLSANSQQDILDFAGLKDGMPIDLEQLRAVRERFWASGRFFRHDIKATWSRTDSGPVNLELDLLQHQNAPPLSSPIQTGGPQDILMRNARSVEQSLAEGQSLLFNVDRDPWHFRVVIQPRYGTLIHLIRDAKLDGSQPSPTDQFDGLLPGGASALDLTFAITVDGLLFSSKNLNHRFEIPGRWELNTGLYAVPNPYNASRPVSFSLNTNVTTLSNRDAPTVLDFVVAPLFCFDFLSAREEKLGPIIVKTSNDVTSIERGTIKIQSDTVSGRLISLEIEANQLRMRISLSNDAIKNEVAALRAAAPINDCDVQHPAGSFVGFLISWYLANPIYDATKSIPFDALQPLLEKVAIKSLGPADRLINWFTSDDPPIFTVADDPGTSSLTAVPAAACTGNYFEYGSWPWTLDQQACLIWGGRSPNAQAELIRTVSSDDTGPVGCAVISAALARVDPQDSRAVARLGLSRLSQQAFDRDFHALFRGDGLAPTTLSDLLQGIADLDDEKAAGLIAAMPQCGNSIRFMRQLARQNPHQKMVDVLASSSDQWWNQSLEKMVEAALDHEAGITGDSGGNN
jgi:hypothetical protein